jgi:hypothetical protein
MAAIILIALPVPLPSQGRALAQDGDLRTIFESRSIAVRIDTPGLHLLHQSVYFLSCGPCEHERDEAQEPRNSPSDDLTVRVAVSYPKLIALNQTNDEISPLRRIQIIKTSSLRPPLPPPKVCVWQGPPAVS